VWWRVVAQWGMIRLQWCNVCGLSPLLVSPDVMSGIGGRAMGGGTDIGGGAPGGSMPGGSGMPGRTIPGGYIPGIGGGMPGRIPIKHTHHVQVACHENERNTRTDEHLGHGKMELCSRRAALLLHKHTSTQDVLKQAVEQIRMR
jgi:hypothetical protein